jgi:hypothetical protein
MTVAERIAEIRRNSLNPDIVDKATMDIEFLLAQLTELAKAARPMIEGTYWITPEQINNLQRILKELGEL